ncbi:MAG TPA: hypothetical protein PKB09_02540 [Candidatus Saccharibacteria bacterium]|nr:hypothetical protein [Candidatus Saccharibacteria bacterium]
MYTHLKERQLYEDIYDRHTVEDARRGMVHYEKFHADFEKKLPKDDKIDRPGNALLLNVFYMQTVGNGLLDRYEKREQSINDWMAKDEAKDEQIAGARLGQEPYCHHCKKQGLRITDKSLMHRGKTYNIGDPEEVLFMLHCTHCDKNSAIWEDGTAWKPRPTLCPKCKAEMKHKVTKSKKALTFTYTCPSCSHSYKDRTDLSDKKEKPDPEYDQDKVTYCLLDKEFRDRMIAIKQGFEDMARLGKEVKEKEDNKHIYDAVKELKKPKIAELTPLLAPTLEKAGYIEFHLDKPEIGRDVFIGFSCLDSKSDREDYDSRKTLQKLVKKTLEDTNWRLMSDGVSYRLGYLNGRLRAYERKDDLKELVIKSKKLKPKQEPSKADLKKNAYTIKDKDGNDILL